MCTEIINGVLVVREGARRLRWLHEVQRHPSPRDPEQWIVGGVWPDANAHAEVQKRIDCGEPVLVVLDHESPLVTLPVENIPRIPDGATVHDADDEMVTVSVPTLNWLRQPERERGEAFAKMARSTIASTPRILLPPLLTENRSSATPDPLQFVHTTGANSSANVGDAVDHLFGTAARRAFQALPIAV